ARTLEKGKPPATAGRKARGLLGDSPTARVHGAPPDFARKLFASLTSGSRAHGVRQAITPWGNSGGFSFYVATMPPVILVAPAAFKGTLGPRQVAEAIATGVRRAVPGATVLVCPVADGGNGLLDVVLPAGALRERLQVTGPIGDSVSAELGWIDGETAIIESASACGLALVEPEDRDPMRTTTRVVALADVATPLLGPGGAAPVFGPQKGARPEEIPQLAAGLTRLAELWKQAGRPELGTMPMGGAAGGLGAGLVFFAKAELKNGAEWVLERAGFDAALAKADLVITGEGIFDKTSLVGKAPGEVVRRAQAARKKVAVVAGR